jgi:hypothetical protein
MKLFKDSIPAGMLLGFLAPLGGFFAFKWYKFGVFTWKEFFQYITLEPGFKTLTVAMTLSLLTNALVFTICLHTRKDEIAKGVFATTAIYGFIILLIKTFA